MPKLSPTPKGSLAGRGVLAKLTALLATLIVLAVSAIAAPTAYADGETLNVAIRSQTGTPEWDDTDGNGYDTGPDNNIIRTNDIPTYRVDVVSNGGTAENAIVELTLPKGQEFKSVPAFCKDPSDTSKVATPSPATMPEPAVPANASSWESLPVQSLRCHIGNIQNGSTQYLSFPAFQRSEVPNGTQLESAKATVKSDFVTTPVESKEDVSMVVSAGPKWNLSKNGTAADENTGYFGQNTVRCFWDSSQVCYVAVFPILIGGDTGGKGSTPLSGPVSFTELLNPTSFYGANVTNSPTWQAAGGDANATYAPRLENCSAPSAIYNQPGNNSDRARSVRRTGTIRCAQSAPGENANVTIEGTDWSLYTAPTRHSTPDTPIPADQAYAVSGVMRIQVPLKAVRDLGTESNGTSTLPFRNEYDDFKGTAVDGTEQPDNVDPTWDNYRTGRATVTRPGGFGKAFAGVPGDANNVPRAEFGAGDSYSEGPPGGTTRRSGENPVAGGQDVVSLLVVSGANIANSQPGSALLCDAWDNTKLQLHERDYPASTTGAFGQVIASGGKAVWNSGNSQSTGPPDYTVQYSGSTVAGPRGGSNCRTGEWYDNPADVPGNDPELAAQGIYTAVSQVRIWTTVEEPRADANGSVRQWYSIGLRSVPGQEARTIQPNWASWNPNFGVELTREQHLQRNNAGSAYNPDDHTGSIGDRLIFLPAFVRINKDASINGGAYSNAVSGTAGDTVNWRLRPPSARPQARRTRPHRMSSLRTACPVARSINRPTSLQR